jgi:AraC family ethanolamine operon transcriptional activator
MSTFIDCKGSPPAASAVAQSRLRVIQRTKAYIRSRLDFPITTADLARVSGVSERTLEYSFQEVLGVNPTTYVKAIRLNGVRRALKSGEAGTDTVAELAESWGFRHLPRFAGDYQRMFGELPSQTLRRRPTESR